MSDSQVVIVGAGIIGSSCAYYLSNAGYSVTLIDKGLMGSGCSHANCGYICPSHVLPIAAPGAIWTALGAMFRKNSPLYIKPRIDPKLWSWLMRFALRCNTRDMSQAADGINSLLQLSMKEYREWMQKGLECEWRDLGLMFVYSSDHEFEAYEKTDKFLRERYGVGARRLSREELCKLEPAVKPTVAGAWYYEQDAQLRPDILLDTLRERLTQSKVEIRENTSFDGFEYTQGKVSGVRTNRGVIPADQVVITVGAWAPPQLGELGLRIPVQPGKGYSITMDRPGVCPKRPMIFHEHRVACTAFEGKYRLGSTMEFSGYDERMNRNRLKILTDVAAQYLVEPVTPVIHEEWFGWRPMTYDGLPIIDYSPKHQNVVVATGHGMLGLSMAPGTGKLVQQLVSREACSIDAGLFSARRFNGIFN